MTLPQNLVSELQNLYNAKLVTMFKIIGCFTDSVAKQLNEKGMTIEERADFFKSEEYNKALINFKSNFNF